MQDQVISVVVVSDYGSSDSTTWKDERRCLASLASKDLAEPFEVLLVESSRSAAPPVKDDDSLRFQLASLHGANREFLQRMTS